MRVTAMTCEHLVEPIGIEAVSPRLGWSLAGEDREAPATVRILVASGAGLAEPGSADLWDSGDLPCNGRECEYGGVGLLSGQDCFWRVIVTGTDGRSAISPVSRFRMGLLAESDWKGRWIKPVTGTYGQLLRKGFDCPRAIRRATAYISGLGYGELHINGSKVGDHVLDPIATQYDRACYHVAHDVTGLLGEGPNAVGVMLGTGWYDCHTKGAWDFDTAPWRDRVKLLFQLDIEYTDGTLGSVVSDGSWVSSQGPVTFDGLRNGEHYDARLERDGWASPGFADDDWRRVEIIPGPGGVMRSQGMPMRITQTIVPVSITAVSPGVWVADMGQSFAGWVRLRVEGAAGTTVTLRYGEMLHPDGTLDQGNINVFTRTGECQTDRYTLKGGGPEVWEPRFTYHGFRYVEITGYPGEPTVDSIEGRVVHTDFGVAGSIETANETLNAIQRCTLWSFRSNFHGFPTDCPHREKNGWTGDANIAAETGLMNFGAEAAYEKWLRDIADAQRPSGQLPGIVPTGGWGYNWGSGPAWDSAYTHIPWYLYLYRGNRRVLAEHYDGMRRYLDFMAGMSEDGILYFGLGDWCPPKGADECPVAVTSTGYYHANARILANAARVLGREVDASSFDSLAASIKDAFNGRFLHASTGRYADGGQTAQSCALYQGLVPEGMEDAVLRVLIDDVTARGMRLNCGILGTKYLFRTLAEHGRADIAYRILMGREHPSYAYWLDNGATTLWENWERANSLNHIMFGDISAWMYSVLAGINPDPENPGFRHTIIRPQPVEGLEWVKAAHESPYGRIGSEWRRTGNGIEYTIILPPGVTCTAETITDEPLGSGVHRFTKNR